jgi:hypothetical protein
MIISGIEHIAIMIKHRRKRSLSAYQKQIRMLTVMAVVMVLSVFAGLIYWINR